METSLHQQLKDRYAVDGAQMEVRLGKYRIDVVTDEHLIEIQLASLAAIRDKIRLLLAEHRVLIVKPIIRSKLLVKRRSERGAVVSRRTSPKRGSLLDLFDELVYFTRVFPHPQLTIEVVLVDIEEWRYPGHGRRRRWHKNDQVVADQKLVAVGESYRIATPADLLRLLSVPMPARFHTGQLAELLDVRRWVAQRIAYCLRQMGAIRAVGKQGNAWVYTVAKQPRPRRRRRAA